MPTRTYLEKAREIFENWTTQHQLTVLHDDGVYHHLHCGRPGDRNWSWDITTWPEHLAVSGDLGSWVFTRPGTHDMLIGFFAGPVNPHYWLEKCEAWDRNTSSQGVVAKHLIEDVLNDHPDLTIEIAQEARELADRLDGDSDPGSVAEMMTFLVENVDEDAFGYQITEPDHMSVRALLSIAWARDQYLARLNGSVATS